jgi:uncharacterized membrane protein
MKARLVLGLGRILALLIAAEGCSTPPETPSARDPLEGGSADAKLEDQGDLQGALKGTNYAPARKFVQTYCSGCHWQDGQDPRQSVAYPAFHVDTYEDWVGGHTILLAVLDKWNPDGDLMPPAGAVQPPDDERRLILDWIRRNSPNTADGL